MLKDILSISGQPGLFKLISRGNNNVIVESILTGKRFPSFSTNKISSLEDIAIYTQSGEVLLNEVFKKISENEDLIKTVTAKSSPADLKNFFTQVLPDYDEDRVYVSHIKKIISWYLLLKEKDLLNFEESPEEKTETKEE